MKDRARELLEMFYLPEAIYLTDLHFSKQEKLADGRFVVPSAHSYTPKPIPYVTAEQYMRCLSQLSYVLVGFLIQSQVTDFTFADNETFKRLMIECQMWFRRSTLRYLKNIPKDTEFQLTLVLKEVSTLSVFAVCTLEVSGVIRGELEFVAPLNEQQKS